MLHYLVDEFYPETGLEMSGAHPRFLLDHVLERCQYEDVRPVLDLARVFDAAHSLIVEGAPPVPSAVSFP